MTPEELALIEFHETFKLAINYKPTLVDKSIRDLRASLIEEEAKEFREACDQGDLVEIADAIADLLYVVYGAAITFGILTAPIFDEVHRSNMTKVWPDGTVKHREDGKVLKPPTYSPANIKGVLGL